MNKFVGAIAVASLAGMAAFPAAATTFSISEPLDTPGALSSPWVVDGVVDPTVVTKSDTPANALQLTDNNGDQTGYALYNQAISVTQGIDITFHQAQYGGDGGADGIVFFVKKGTDTSTVPGAAGGGLGFNPSSEGPSDGLSGALLGVGLDAYGNFANADGDGSDCATTFTRSDGGGGANAITVRGPGQGLTGYCMLADSFIVTDHDLDPISAGYTSRAEADRTVRVVIDPATATSPKVTVYYQGTLTVQVPLPAEFLDQSTVKVGFSSGTGGSTDYHDVWGLTSVAAVDALAETGTDVNGFGLTAAALVAAGGIALAVRRRKA